MTFEKELEPYRNALLNWVKEGRWTLILGDEIAGVFDDFAEALDFSCEKYGLAHLMVKSIHQVEPVVYLNLPMFPVRSLL